MASFVEALREQASENRIACAAALRLAARHGVDASTVAGLAAEAGITIVYCQLGLFGYHSFGGKGVSTPLREIPERLRSVIRERSADGALPCADVWAIAEASALPRLVLASAADAMGIHIAPCQLGCF
jgi:hypothetical protein